MKLLTASLEGKALDWALAKAKKNDWREVVHDQKVEIRNGVVCLTEYGGWSERIDHTDPALCLKLIEQHKLDLVYRAELWGAEIPHTNNQFWSSSLSRAVARCVVAMRLGDEVDVPDELCGQRKEGV